MCIVMQVVLFQGMKRFSDIERVRVVDVRFRDDGVVEITMGKTKTDQEVRGSTFVLMVGDVKRGLLMAAMLRRFFS